MHNMLYCYVCTGFLRLAKSKGAGLEAINDTAYMADYLFNSVSKMKVIVRHCLCLENPKRDHLDCSVNKIHVHNLLVNSFISCAVDRT